MAAPFSVMDSVQTTERAIDIFGPAQESSETIQSIPAPIEDVKPASLQLRRAKKAVEKEKRAREMGAKARENIERRRRNRKDAETMALLRHEYDLARHRGHYWTKDSCRPVAERVGLSVNQVYKWGWDQRKKEEAASKQR